MKKLVMLTVASVLFASMGLVALASSLGDTPAEVYANLKGITVEEAVEERQDGSTYGELAEDAELFEEFKAAMLESKAAQLDALVEEGKITREEADALIEQMTEYCDGNPGNARHLMREYMRGNNGKGRGYGRGGRFGKGGCGFSN